MAKRIQGGQLFYHVTALENLKGILMYGLLSRQDAVKQNLLKTNVADSEIIEKRRVLGILGYVPFHFFEPTPFTGAVYNKYVDTSFCVITIHRDFAQQNNFKICTAHPLSKNPKPQVLNYSEGLKAIDWKAMESRDYHDEKSKNVAMAECLAISPVSPMNFNSIFVPSEAIKQEVNDLVMEILENYPFYININPSFTQEGKNG